MRRTTLAALCLTAVATAGLTGCGGEDKKDSSTAPGSAAQNIAKEGSPPRPPRRSPSPD
ncbi:hypothetical protein SHKM778_85900 [Streptomyces sp. KM77-8]|uniref:Uncharacterized protein n=1 Tax=Streptomyces haneummycinicus TaxID=3074435 RepID=A0AAT9HWX6_9ACTN